jgi:hypothetical protein
VPSAELVIARSLSAWMSLIACIEAHTPPLVVQSTDCSMRGRGGGREYRAVGRGDGGAGRVREGALILPQVVTQEVPLLPRCHGPGPTLSQKRQVGEVGERWWHEPWPGG